MWDTELPKEKRSFNPIVLLVWGLIIFVICGIGLGVYKMLIPEKSGIGNVLNYAYVTEFKDEIYFVNPQDERIVRLRDTKAEAVTETGAIYLTCIEDDLYYVSTETGFFMRYRENGEDEVVLDYGCNNPIFWEGKLYFSSGMESQVYAVSVTEGVFSDPVCIHEDIQVVSFSIEDGKIYYVPATGMGLWCWTLDAQEAPKKLSDAFCGQPMATDGEVYYQVMSDTFTGIRVIRKNGEEETLVETPASCLNMSGSWVYFTNLSEEAGGCVYRVRKNGMGKPERVTRELGADLQIVAGDVYYRTNLPQGGMVWKRMPVGETNIKTDKAEYIGMQ